jgi:hypothetical protein
MAYSVKITNKNSKVFLLQEAECPNGTYALNTKLFKQAMPGEDPDKAIIINLGRETDVNFTINLRNGTADATDGTDTSCTTIQEKFDYLLDTFITPGLQDGYTIDITANNITRTGIRCTIESFSIDFASEKPGVQPGMFKFSIGGANQIP